jgi:hypothetical protein
MGRIDLGRNDLDRIVLGPERPETIKFVELFFKNKSFMNYA